MPPERVYPDNFYTLDYKGRARHRKRNFVEWNTKLNGQVIEKLHPYGKLASRKFAGGAAATILGYASRRRIAEDELGFGVGLYRMLCP